MKTWSLIVMPLSLSKSMLSRNWSFISRWGTVPVTWSNLSAKVDFPWSICAMMLKFLILDTGTWKKKTKPKPKPAWVTLHYKLQTNFQFQVSQASESGKGNSGIRTLERRFWPALAADSKSVLLATWQKTEEPRRQRRKVEAFGIGERKEKEGLECEWNLVAVVVVRWEWRNRCCCSCSSCWVLTDKSRDPPQISAAIEVVTLLLFRPRCRRNTLY